MSKKQATVRVPDPDLLAECSELLERQIGRKLPQATIVSAALTALKNQHVHQLITQEDCRAWALKATICTSADIIQLLMNCGLCAPGKYEVVAHPDKGVQVIKDGRPLSDPGDRPEPTSPDWVSEVIATEAQKKAAVN